MTDTEKPLRKSGQVRHSTSTTRQNAVIDALRAIAAILVVASHAKTLFWVNYTDAPASLATVAFYSLTTLGHESVMVFFTLSGYWVGGGFLRAHQKNSFKWTEYSVSRITRLWLVLIPAVILTAILDRVGSTLSGGAAIYAGDSRYSDIVLPHVLDRSSIGHAAGNIFFLQANGVSTYGTNGPLWSIAYEAAYYFLFPAAFLAFAPKIDWRVRLANLAVTSACLAYFGYHVLALFPVWLIGVLAYFMASRWSQFSSAGMRAFSTALLIGCVMTIDQLPLGGTISGALIGAATGIFLITFHQGFRARGIAGRSLVKFSKIAQSSFSLYAIHFPILVLITALAMPNPDDRLIPSWRSSLVLIAAVILCMLIAASYAYFTERHTDRLRKRILRSLSGRVSPR